MPIVIDEKNKCCGCSACYSVCPEKCIEMKDDEQGFFYPNVKTDLCIKCERCTGACPIKQKSETKHEYNLGFAAFSLDEKIRKSSASGGISYVLARYIISQGGIVYGVSFDDSLKKAIYIRTESESGLNKIRGSKYLQSFAGSTFRDVKKDLDNDRLVYFTGTPCQIDGLYSYLGKNYNNLITQDIICYGVNSPVVWKDYLTLIENKYKSRCKSVVHRDKSTGWRNYSLSFLFENGKKYEEISTKSPFIRGFLLNMYLRPSCYECKFKADNRRADITLADYWGVEFIEPSLDDDNGLSFVWIHTQKGFDCFSAISKECFTKEINVDETLKYNYGALHSADHAERSEWFWNRYNGKNMKWLVRWMKLRRK